MKDEATSSLLMRLSSTLLGWVLLTLLGGEPIFSPSNPVAREATRGSAALPAQTAALASEGNPYDSEIDRLAASGLHEEAFALKEWWRAHASEATRPHDRPVTVRELQSHLPEGVVVLSFSLGKPRSHAWAVGRHSFSAFDLSGSDEIEPAAAEVIRLFRTGPGLSARAQAERALDRLSHTLLDPVAPALGVSGARLIIVPDGALRAVPFAALPAPGLGAFAPLNERYELVEAASAFAAFRLGERELRRQPGDLFAVVGDPIYGQDDPRLAGRREPAGPATSESSLARGLSAEAPPYPRLRFAAREVEAIRALLPVNRSSVWLGASASRETLLGADLRRYRFLHFATHGVLGGNGLGESALVLSRFDSRGRPQPALLTSSEIARLHISADLVVLSACDSALGQGDAGEGATGLGQSFLEAGAKSVLVSLWSVDDRATEELMTQFYRNLLQQRLSPASALRQAQLSLSHRPPWDDPFYWAGFVLVGDGG